MYELNTLLIKAESSTSCIPFPGFIQIWILLNQQCQTAFRSLFIDIRQIVPGLVHGETDDFSYNIVKDPVHVHDFHATALKLLGFDHLRFTYRYQGLDQRLTGVVPASVVDQLIA